MTPERKREIFKRISVSIKKYSKDLKDNKVKMPKVLSVIKKI